VPETHFKKSLPKSNYKEQQLNSGEEDRHTI